MNIFYMKNVFQASTRRNKCLRNIFGWRKSLQGNSFSTEASLKALEVTKKSKNLLPLLAFSIPFLDFFRSDSDDEEKEDEMITILKRGVLATRAEEYDKAEQFFHLGLKIAQERIDDQAITYIYILMANLALTREEYDKAEILFRNVLQRLISDGMALDDNSLIEIGLKLAKICSKKGELETAVEGFRFCIATQEDKIKNATADQPTDEDTIALLGMSQQWYAEFLITLKQYKLARENFLKSYEICAQLKGPDSCHAAVLLNNLGTVHVNEEKYSDGIELIKKAIDISKEATDCEEYLSSFHTNLGVSYLMKNDKNTARYYCNEGLKLAKIKDFVEYINEARECLSKIKSTQN